MKKIKILTLTAVLCTLAACCGQPKQYSGTIVDASMNNVVVKELTSDQTAIFSTEDADMTQANGLLLGNLITIDYKGDLKDVTPAIKVATDATYAKAIGNWVMPDPIAADSVMGIRIMIEGQAESINMATLRYTGWELQGEESKILLHGTSEGTGDPIDFTQTATLMTSSEGVQTLSIDDTEVVLTKEAL